MMRTYNKACTLFRYLLFIFAFTNLHCLISFASDDVQLMWKFQTGGKVYSSPTIDGDVVYIGSWDSCLYAINRLDGTQKWKFKANYPIQSKPALYQNIVCFESGDEFWGLDKETGQTVWNYFPQIYKRKIQYDTWDYHHSSPVLVDSTFFVGCGNGKVYGINASDGTIVFEYLADSNYAVRSNVTFNDSILYFGNWYGTFYALDMRNKSILWSEATNIEGAPKVTSSGVIYKDMLFFGGRCTEVFCKDAKTGVTRWKYTDPIGSWMLADPVIDNGVLFFGGSDNNSMFAFQPETGTILWKAKDQHNILSTPFVGTDYVLFVTENSYGNGPGALWVVDKNNGVLRNDYQLVGDIISSPCVVDDVVYFGCEDGYVYALQGLTSTVRQYPLISCSLKGILFTQIPSTVTSADTSFYVYNHGSGYDSVTVNILVSKSIQSAFSVSPSAFLILPGDSQKVTFSVLPNLLNTGIFYNLNISIKSQYNILQNMPNLPVTVRIVATTSVKESKTETKQFHLNQNYPNPFNPSTRISYYLPEDSMVRLLVLDMRGRVVDELIKSYQHSGEYAYQYDIGKNSSGIYFLQLNAGKNIMTRKMCVVK